MKWPCALPLDILMFVLWSFGACNLGLVDKLCGVDKDDQLFWQVCNIGRAGTFGHVNLNLNHLWTKKPNRLFWLWTWHNWSESLKAPLALLFFISFNRKNDADVQILRLRPVAAESWDRAGAPGAVHGLAPQRHKSLAKFCKAVETTSNADTCMYCTTIRY